MLHNHTHPYLQHAQNAEQRDGNIKKIVPLIHFKHVLNVDLVPQDYIKTIAHNSNQLAHAPNAKDQKVDTKKHVLNLHNKNVPNVVACQAPIIKTALTLNDQNVLNVEEQRKVTKKHAHNTYLEKNVQNVEVVIWALIKKNAHTI